LRLTGQFENKLCGGNTSRSHPIFSEGHRSDQILSKNRSDRLNLHWCKLFFVMFRINNDFSIAQSKKMNLNSYKELLFIHFLFPFF
jgi:hypothetical protein